MWVDFAYYRDKFLLGRSPLISETDFPFWSAEAQDRINKRNINRVEITDPPTELQRCVCKIAERLFQSDTAPKAGDVISESNSGYSYTLERANPKTDEDKEINGIISEMLIGTSVHNIFVYAGIGR